MEFISEYSQYIIIAMFLFFAAAEMIITLDKSNGRMAFRWFTNFSMTLCIVSMFKLGELVLAILTASSAHYFAFGLYKNLGLSLALVLGIVTLDLKQYLFHRLVHYYDFLWRIHQVHHSDVKIDPSTGFCFYPLEAIISMLMDIIVIAVFGIAVEVLLLRYVLSSFVNYFSHGNFYTPPTFDRYLKLILVTPSMHHLHHALEIRASNRNFGVLFSFWDRIFGTYMNATFKIVRHDDFWNTTQEAEGALWWEPIQSGSA